MAMLVMNLFALEQGFRWFWFIVVWVGIVAVDGGTISVVSVGVGTASVVLLTLKLLAVELWVLHAL